VPPDALLLCAGAEVRRPSGSFVGGAVVAVCVAIVVSTGVAFVVSAGGAPQSPSHGSWVDQAHTSLQEVDSNVATALLLVRLAERNKIMGDYQQIVALDSESAAGKVSSHFSGEQPEPAEQNTYKTITTVLSDADDLLSAVRIAIVRRDAGQFTGLERALTKMRGELAKAERRVPS
jgi:hypothetical protein